MASPTPTPTSTSTRTTHLRNRAHAFCTAFTSNTPPTELLNKFFTPSPTILEHGPEWAQSCLPFLGKTFVGRRRQPSPTNNPASTSSTSNPDLPSQHENESNEENEDTTSCDAYFDLLSRTLSFHPTENTFPPAEDIVVDAEADSGTGVVSVVGRAEFRSVRTGKGWVEEFVWRLGGWDREGRVGRWEIWADPLSAWVAVGGKGEGEREREEEGGGRGS